MNEGANVQKKYLQMDGVDVFLGACQLFLSACDFTIFEFVTLFLKVAFNATVSEFGVSVSSLNVKFRSSNAFFFFMDDICYMSFFYLSSWTTFFSVGNLTLCI